MQSRLENIQEYFNLREYPAPSAFEHVSNHINPHGPGLMPGGETLPDEDDFIEPPGVKWAPGARDAVISQLVLLNSAEKADWIERFVQSIKNLSGSPGNETIREFESVLKYPDTLGVIDQALKRIVTDTGLNQTVIYYICRNLFLRSPFRGVVKFAMSIMGLYGVPQDIDLFKIIGRHDEFTIYSAVALAVGGEDTESHWLDMAKKVTGWGRIHLVLRLVDSKNPEVLDFLLKEGCRNDIMPEYTALMIAEAVDLVSILSKKKIDSASFRGAGIILKALFASYGGIGPFEGIELYKDGAPAVKNYLNHFKKIKTDDKDYETVSIIFQILLGDKGPYGRNLLDWKIEDREYILKTAGEILEMRKTRTYRL